MYNNPNMIIHSGQELQAIHDCEPGDQLELDLASGRSATFTFSRVLTPQGVVEVIFHPLGQRNSFHLSEISRARKIDPFVPTPCTDDFLDPADVTAAILGSDPEVPLILYMEKDTHYLGSARILEEGRIFEFTDLAGNPYKLPMSRVVSLAHLLPEARWGRQSLAAPTERAFQEPEVCQSLSERCDQSCSCAETSTNSSDPTDDNIPEEPEEVATGSQQPIIEMELKSADSAELPIAPDPCVPNQSKSEPPDLDDEPDDIPPKAHSKDLYSLKLPLSAFVLPEYHRGNSYKSPDQLASNITYSQFVSATRLKGKALSTPDIEDALCTTASYSLGSIQFKNGIVASGGLAINILRGTGRMICAKERWSLDFRFEDIHRILELKP